LLKNIFLAGFIFLLANLNALQAQTNDVPIMTQNTLVGNYRQVISGVSFYPDLTSNNFNINLPSCASGTPTVAFAYINWQGRIRRSEVVVALTFDDNLNVQINAGTVTAVPADFMAVGDSPRSGDRIMDHFTGYADVTTLV